MINITQQPYEFTPKGQRLIYTATSTNVAEPGFRYKVEVAFSSGASTIELYISPNPANALQFDAAPIVYEHLRNKVIGGSLGPIIHAIAGATLAESEEDGNGVDGITVSVTEAWEVLGVLTDDPDNEGTVASDKVYVFNAHFQFSLGYRPNPATYYALAATTDYVMSDRVPSTHVWDLAETNGFTPGNNRIFIPVREADYGVLTVPADDGTTLTGNVAAKVRIGIVQSNGSTATSTHTLTPLAGDIQHLGVYPANLNDSTIVGIVKPEDYPNWKALYITILDASNNLVSATYVLYNTDVFPTGSTCDLPVIRLGWVSQRMGWDYFNFTMKSEESMEVQRRPFNKVIGDYASTTFTFNSFDRGMTERQNIADRFITVNSDWIQEGEFEFLKNLITSNEVHWVQDDGTFVPVTVEDSTYRIRRDYREKVNVTLRLKLAQHYNA